MKQLCGPSGRAKRRPALGPDASGGQRSGNSAAKLQLETNERKRQRRRRHASSGSGDPVAALECATQEANYAPTPCSALLRGFCANEQTRAQTCTQTSGRLAIIITQSRDGAKTRGHRRLCVAAKFLAHSTLNRSLLLALLLLALNQQACYEAIKLPSFLSSWMGPAGSPSSSSSLSSSASSSLAASTVAPLRWTGAGAPFATQLTFGEPMLQSHYTTVDKQQVRSSTVGPTSRRIPFQFGGVKHTGSALLSSLPKSLFGRILSAGSNSAQSNLRYLSLGAQAAGQQQQQQQASGLQIGPSQWQIAQQIQQQFATALAAAASQQRQQQQFSAQQKQQSMKFNEPVAPAQMGAEFARFAQHGSQLGPQQQQQQQQEQEPKKHALGYGESNDFVIVNAQQVAELQKRPPGSGPGEDYREMPAIVIADPEMEPLQQHFVPGFMRTVQLKPTNETTNSSTTDEPVDVVGSPQQQHEQQKTIDLLKLDALNSTSNSAGEQVAANVTVAQENIGAEQRGPDATTKQLVVSNLDQVADQANSSAPMDQSQVVASKNDTQRAVEMAVDDALQAQPPNRGLDSAASGTAPVVVNANEQMDANEQQGEQGVESFVLGPFKGLDDSNGFQHSLGPQQHINNAFEIMSNTDSFTAAQNLAPFQTAPNEMQQQQQQQPPAQIIQQQHHHQQPPRPQIANLLQQARNLLHSSPFSSAFATHFVAPQKQQDNHFGQLSGPNQQLLEMPSHQMAAQFAPADFGAPALPQHFYSNSQPHRQHSAADASVRPAQLAHNKHQFLAKTWTQQAGQMGAGHSNRFFQMKPQQQQASGANMQQYLYAEPNMIQPQQQQHYEQQPRTTAFNMIINHGNSRPSGYNFEQAQQQPSVAELAAANQQQQQRQGKFKSGLYQIEPPKLEVAARQLEAARNKQKQQVNDAELEDDDNEDEQQKVDGQDYDSQESQKMQPDNEETNDTEHRQTVALPESKQIEQAQQLAASIGVSAGNVSSVAPILVLGGGEPSRTNGSKITQFEQVEPLKKGLVFNEQVSTKDTKLAGQHAPNAGRSSAPPEVTFYDFYNQYQDTQLREQRLQQQPQMIGNNYLDTQVYTLPYTLTMHPDGQAYLAPQVPKGRSFKAQQQQQQQQVASGDHRFSLGLPLKFHHQQHRQQFAMQPDMLTAGPHPQMTHGDWSQMSLPLPIQRQQAIETNNKEHFFHYQPSFPTLISKQQQLQLEAPRQNQPPHNQQQQQFARPFQAGQVYSSNLVESQQQPSGNSIEQRAPSELRNESVDFEFGQHQESAATTSVPSTVAQVEHHSGSTEIEARPTSTEPTSVIVVDSTTLAADPIAVEEQHQRQPVAKSPSSFCAGRTPGLYADIEQRCRAYYQCAPTGHQMFNCNNQTQFNQRTQNCDWWYNVDCGGRLGSPGDFEQSRSGVEAQQRQSSSDPSMLQASQASAPQVVITEASEQASNDYVEALPTSSTASYSTGPSAATPGSGDSGANSTSTASDISDGSTTSVFSQPQSVSTEATKGNQSQLVTMTTTTTTQANNSAGESTTSQPRVGAQPNEEQQQQQQQQQTTSEQTISSNSYDQRSDETTETSVGRQSALEQTDKRRLIQSEFGSGAMQQQQRSAIKAARAAGNAQVARLSQFRQSAGNELARGPMEFYDGTTTTTTTTTAITPLQQTKPQIYSTSANHQGSITYMQPDGVEKSVGSGKLERRFGTRLVPAVTTTTLRPVS